MDLMKAANNAFSIPSIIGRSTIPKGTWNSTIYKLQYIEPNDK